VTAKTNIQTNLLGRRVRFTPTWVRIAQERATGDVLAPWADRNEGEIVAVVREQGATYANALHVSGLATPSLPLDAFEIDTGRPQCELPPAPPSYVDRGAGFVEVDPVVRAADIFDRPQDPEGDTPELRRLRAEARDLGIRAFSDGITAPVFGVDKMDEAQLRTAIAASLEAKLERAKAEAQPEFRVGDRVLFGRGKGEQTRGKVVKVNAKSIKVETVEQRGTKRKVPAGTVYRVPKSMARLAKPRGA